MGKLPQVGLARVGLPRVGLVRVGSVGLELVYCILLDSISGTAPLDIFPTSPARSAGLVGNLTILNLRKPRKSIK